MEDIINELPDFDFTIESDVEVETPNNETSQEDVVEDTPVANNEIESLYNIYKDNGFIKEDEANPYEKTYDGIYKGLMDYASRIEDDIFNGVVKSAPDWAQPLIELSLTKGQDLSKEEFLKFAGNLVDSKANITDEQYLAKSYKEAFDWSDEDINDRISLLKDAERLDEEVAKLKARDRANQEKALQSQIEQARQSKQNRIAAQSKFENILTKALTDNYNAQRSSQLSKSFYSGQFKQSVEDVFQKPEQLRYLLEFMSYYKDGKFDLETYQKEAFSPDVKKIKSKAESYFKNSHTTTSPEKRKQPINLKDYEITLD